MQAGARDYPAPPFPKQHQNKPGSESKHEPAPPGNLESKVALITGGDSGIGRAVAILFAREGARVALAYINEHKDAKLTKEEVEAEGGKCILSDVSGQKFCEKAVARSIKELGSLDILVNNATFPAHTSRVEDLTAKHFDETLKTNLYGYVMAQAAVRHMKPSIINTGSFTGLLGSESVLDYSMTKGGIHAFTRSLATHLVPRGIRVNAVAPGPVWTLLNPADKEAKDVSKFGY